MSESSYFSLSEDSNDNDHHAASSSRALKALLVAGLLIYFLVLVVANVPATLAAWAVHKAVPTLWLTSVDGTVWNGRAGGAQVDMGAQTMPLGEVTWTLSPWSLLILKPCLNFETEVPNQMISGSICQSPFGRTTAKDINIEAPISVINELLPMEAAGQLSLQVLSVDLSGQQVNQLDARFSWQKAAVHNGERWITLGSFGGTAQANGQGGVAAQIFDIDGAFGVDLKAGWAPGVENWTATGTVKPRENAPQQVVQALQAFTEETSPGTYQITWP